MIEKKRDKKILGSWIVLNFGIAFMFCIFAPIDAFYANSDEYWFSLGQMLSVCIVVFMIVLLILSFISYFISKTKADKPVFAISFALFVTLYIQGNYIPRNYGVLNGNDIDWGSYTGYAIASIVLFLVGIVIAYLFAVKFSQYLPDVAKYGALFIISIQLVTIATLMIQNGIPMGNAGAVTTQKDMLNLSEDHNVIVFLLDTYDSSDFDYVWDNDTENQKTIFENFTYYRDTLGAYPTTKGAMPFILTGQWYQNEEAYEFFVDKAYANNSIYEEFKKNDYELDMYTSTMYLNDDVTVYENIDIGSYSINNRLGFAGILYKLIAFNYVPHQLKSFFYVDTGEFSDLKKSDLHFPVFSSDVVKFSKQIDEKGLSISKKGNVFKFYHLDGVHGPCTFSKDLIENRNAGYTSYDEAAGNNTLLKRYFDELKELGIYDSSTIIVMADHGHTEYSQNPIFLIKNTGESHDFKISQEKMSYEYLKNIWIALAKGEKVDEQFISEQKPALGRRRFLFYRWDDAWKRDYLPAMEEFLCDKGAFDFENLVASGRKYYAEEENREYSLGETLDFIDGRSAYSHVLYGISYGNVMKAAQLVFDIDEEYTNLKMELTLEENSLSKVVEIFVNGEPIAEQILSFIDGETINIGIPGNLVKDHRLELEFKCGEDSDDAQFINSGVRIHSINIVSVNEAIDLSSQFTAYNYETGDNIAFAGEDANCIDYIVTGFSNREQWGTWTDGNEALMRFKGINTDADLVLDMDYQVFNGSQRVDVECNGQIVSSFTASGGEQQIRIPNGIVNDGEINIRFILPDAISPFELGSSSDGRKLGIGFHSMSIDEEVKYEYGSDITFVVDDNSALPYIASGFSGPEGDFTWTDGQQSELMIPVKRSNSDLELHAQAGTFNGPQRVVMFVDGDETDHFVVEGDTDFDTRIPVRYTEDGLLNIMFEFPDAVSPKELGINEDVRVLALSFRTMSINPVDIPILSLGEEIRFTTENNNAQEYVVSGFSGAEDWGTWTDGTEAELQFQLQGIENDEELNLNLDYNTYGAEQHVTIMINDQIVSEFVATGSETRTVSIPASILGNDGVNVRFILPDASSPADKGESSDRRKLALGFKSIMIEEHHQE